MVIGEVDFPGVDKVGNERVEGEYLSGLQEDAGDAVRVALKVSAPFAGFDLVRPMQIFVKILHDVLVAVEVQCRMVFLKAIENGPYVLFLQKFLLFDVDGVDQITLTILFRDTCLSYLYHSIFTIALKAEEEILLKHREEDILPLLFLAVEMQKVINISINH